MNKIGGNINQTTHYFNGSKDAERRLFHKMGATGRYEKITALAEKILVEID